MVAAMTPNRDRIDPRSIAFDIDGVVADTMGLFLTLGQDLFGIAHVRYTDITDYHLDRCLDIDPQTIGAIVERIIEGDYDCPLEPLRGAAKVLRRLGHYGPIRMVTARPKTGPMASWMEALLLPERHPVEITATGSFEAKADVLAGQGVSHFVEDRLETCFFLEERGITPVLFRQPWNRQPHPFIEVSDWDQLEDLINFES
jgi:uncharacterized protein